MASTQPTPASLPLFPTNHPHRLSELDLDPRYGYFFGIGYLLAIAHRDGIANRNLQASKLSPQPGTGLFYLLSWQKEEVKLSPQSMAGDFLKPFATFDAPGFQAVLAGYVQSAYIQLEPLYPGYVREFLAVIGGTPERVPAPAPPLLDLAAQLQNLNRKLVLKDGHLSLEITGTAKSRRRIPAAGNPVHSHCVNAQRNRRRRHHRSQYLPCLKQSRRVTGENPECRPRQA